MSVTVEDITMSEKKVRKKGSGRKAKYAGPIRRTTIILTEEMWRAVSKFRHEEDLRTVPDAMHELLRRQLRLIGFINNNHKNNHINPTDEQPP